MITGKLILPVLALFLITGCGSGTSVEMTRTIDVLEAIGVSPGATAVEGFRLGLDLHAPLLTEALWTAESRTLPAAGGETGAPCNDGTAYRLTKSGGRGPDDLFIAVEVIGDTGGGDISGDRDCGCDTHIKRLLFNQLRIEPEPPFVGYADLEFGKDELCPNRLDDLVVGDGEFGGPVAVDLSAALRVVDGGLFLEVTYFAQDAP